MELDDRELERLKKLVPYKVLAPTSDEICDEIERLKKENAILKQTMCDESLLINENALLKDIIKEVREYIEPLAELDNDIMLKGKMLKPVLEILDKESYK